MQAISQNMQKPMKISDCDDDMVIDQNQVLIKDLAAMRHEFEKFKKISEEEINYLKLSNLALSERVKRLENQLQTQSRNGIKNNSYENEKKPTQQEKNEKSSTPFVPQQVKEEVNFKFMETESDESEKDADMCDKIKCESKN